MSELYSNFQGYLQLNIPRIKWIVIFGLLFFVVFCFLHVKGYTRKGYKQVIVLVCGFVLSMNCSFTYVMTVFGRRMGEQYRFKLMPFHSYFMVFSESNMEILLQILVNIAMYIPIGLLLPCCFKVFEKYRRVIFAVLVVSLLIELIQGIFRLGLFETDDVMNNMLGMMIGNGIYQLSRKVTQHVFKYTKGD